MPKNSTLPQAANDNYCRSNTRKANFQGWFYELCFLLGDNASFIVSYVGR